MNERELYVYFKRIGLNYDDYKDRDLDSKMLNELCLAHSLTIPFENIDILNGKPLSLKAEDLYDKVILHNRGGNCFEINGLCTHFLRSLGFGVDEYFSRFFRDAGDNIPMRRHRLLKVNTTDGEFIWDIGIGMRSPRITLRLTENLVQKQFGEIYKYVKEAFYGWVLYEYHNDEWLRILSFTEEPQAECDFYFACSWCEIHPDSFFNKQNMVALKTLDGRKTLDGNVYKEFVGNECIKILDLTDDEVKVYLKNEFGIEA